MAFSKLWGLMVAVGLVAVSVAGASGGFSVEFMDLSADPRQDFGRYAAGGWVDANPIPADKSRWGSFDEIGEANAIRLRKLFEDAASKSGEPGSPQQMVGDFFTSVLDAVGRERRGLEPIADLRRVIAEANDLPGIIQASRELGRAGVTTWVAAAVFGDRRDAKRYGLYFFQTGLSLPDRPYYEEERFAKERQALRDHMFAMFVLAGDDSVVAGTKADAVMSIETQIATFSKTAVERRDPAKNTFFRTATEMAEQAPGIPWEEIWAGFELTPDYSAIVTQPEYYTGVAKLMQERPVAELQAWLEFNLYDTYARVLTQAMATQSRAFYRKALNGIESSEPAWREAMREVEGSIDMAVGQLYVQQYFPEDVRERMNDMVERVKRAFARRLENLDWMEDETRTQAIEKFSRFRAQVGFPKVWRDYDGLVIRADDAAGNFRRARYKNFERSVNRIGELLDPEEWGISPHVVNAYFSQAENKIVFLAGILQPPMFDAAADDALNYGGIGAVIGHEITHGFDDSGRKYDANGNLRDWWTEADAAAFQERAQGLIDQFNSYEALPGLHINGALALGENIADLGGIHVAWDALQELWAEKGKPEPIDGLTAEQRFFIGWAQAWRTQYREAAMKVQVTRGPHAPGNFRAFGAVVNHPAFHEAFGTRPGDAMYKAPEDQVRIW